MITPATIAWAASHDWFECAEHDEHGHYVVCIEHAVGPDAEILEDAERIEYRPDGRAYWERPVIFRDRAALRAWAGY